MDVKAKIDEIVKKVKTDDAFKKKFSKEPVKAIEELLGVDLPDEQINKIVKGVQSKLKLNKITSALSGLFGKKK